MGICRTPAKTLEQGNPGILYSQDPAKSFEFFDHMGSPNQEIWLLAIHRGLDSNRSQKTARAKP